MWFFGRDTKESLLETSRAEQYDAIERLIQSATMEKGYYLFLILAVLIITPGILIENTPVIIGGMILAPLIIPILSLSLSFVAGSLRGVGRSAVILLQSLIITVGLSAGMTLILARTGQVVTWIPTSIDSDIYLFIAFCSGIAAAFAFVKKDLASNLAGVAIAVSLLPPLSATGIALALGQYVIVRNSLVIFLANFLGISIAAFLVFWGLGFLTSGQMEEKVITQEEKKG